MCAEEFFMKCEWCEKEYETIEQLSRHVGRYHKGAISKEDLYVKYVLDGTYPSCACGCGSKPKFITMNKGYSEFLLGHSQRVNNNWGHNKEAQKKSQATRRKEGTLGFQKGYTPWNKGETKDTNNSVASMSQRNARKSKFYSDKMKDQWSTGNLEIRTGDQHSQWKGGKSRLTALCHSNKRLYNEWKYPALVRAGFSCEKCEVSDNLHVHHDQEWMSAIISKVLDGKDERELTFEERLEIAERVAEYHVDNSVSSQVLCETCHKEVHNFLNF